MHIKKGDKVMVMAGKDKGKTGTVIKAMPGKNRVVIEGINTVVKHQKPTQKMQQGGRLEMEGSISASNVLVYCEKDKTGVRTGFAIDGDRKSRVCKKCGSKID